MKHIKYKSLTNHYNYKSNNPLMRVAVTEKIDGSNLQIITDGYTIRLGSRNSLASDDWHGLNSVLHEDLLARLMKLAIDKKGVVRLIGEVFSSKILKRIPYGVTRAVFFDLMIDGEYVSFKELLAISREYGFEDNIIAHRIMTQKEALSIDLESYRSGFADSIAEGIVIASYDTVDIDSKVHRIKCKSAAFSEMTVRKTQVVVDDALVCARNKYGQFINENRVISYLSKLASYEKQNMGSYILDIQQDAWRDFELAYPSFANTEPGEARKITRVFGRDIAKMIMLTREA